jgi:hypothetical protein
MLAAQRREQRVKQLEERRRAGRKACRRPDQPAGMHASSDRQRRKRLVARMFSVENAAVLCLGANAAGDLTRQM